MTGSEAIRLFHYELSHMMSNEYIMSCRLVEGEDQINIAMQLMVESMADFYQED